jgi:hypothetical protein
MEICVANIGPRQRRRRLLSGLAALLAAAGAMALLHDAPAAARALLFLPLLGAALGIFQFLEKT